MVCFCRCARLRPLSTLAETQTVWEIFKITHFERFILRYCQHQHGGRARAVSGHETSRVRTRYEDCAGCHVGSLARLFLSLLFVLVERGGAPHAYSLCATYRAVRQVYSGCADARGLSVDGRRDLVRAVSSARWGRVPAGKRRNAPCPVVIMMKRVRQEYTERSTVGDSM